MKTSVIAAHTGQRRPVVCPRPKCQDAPCKRRWSFWQWLGLAFVLYIYPALVFTVDNDFFDGQLFTRLPSEVRAVAKFVYWPFEAMGQVWGDD